MAEHSVDLALQGGGSHGAFTWGVLDRFITDPDIRIGGLSGTSTGAMNAVAFASGFGRGGRQSARESLTAFWKSISQAGSRSLNQELRTVALIKRLPREEEASGHSYNASLLAKIDSLILHRVETQK